MKQYRITVNGVSYQVEVEEIKEGESAAQPVSRPTPAPVPRATKQESAPVSKPTPAPVSAGANTMKAPMPGTILKVMAQEGQAVTRGEVLCILEAMKMENEIVAPQDGVVGRIYIKEQQNVQLDAPLLDLE